MPKVVAKPSVCAQLAMRMAEAAVQKATALNVARVAAVLDDGGSLKAFCRMDGASPLLIEIAQSKAFTALFGMPTHDFFDFIKKEPSLLAGIAQTARVSAIGGGLPIRVDGAVIGAIGVDPQEVIGGPLFVKDAEGHESSVTVRSSLVPTAFERRYVQIPANRGWPSGNQRRAGPWLAAVGPICYDKLPNRG